MMEPRPPSTYFLQSPHVVVVEDNTQLRQEILLPALRDYGFRPQGAATAAELYRVIQTQRFDIAVLDIGLPDEDGLVVAKHLRATSDIGIVMLTGHEGRHHHLNALKHGADFYLTKPVDLDLLAATLHNLTRRLPQFQAHGRETAKPTALPCWRLEGGGWRLISPRGKVFALSATEQCVMVTLAAGSGVPASRDALIRALADNVHDFDPHRLEMVIHRLRRRAMEQTGERLPLATVRGNGYLLNCDRDSSVPMTVSSDTICR